MTDDRQVDPNPAVIDLPNSTQAAAIAREFVRSRHADLSPDVLSDAELMVSELVTNAVLHGSPRITLRVRWDPPRLGIDVTDRGEHHPTLPDVPPGPDAAGGRGLLIVDTLASSWGVRPSEPAPGKTVWFEI